MTKCDWASYAVGVEAVGIAADFEGKRSNHKASIGAPTPRSIMLLSPRVNDLPVVLPDPRLLPTHELVSVRPTGGGRDGWSRRCRRIRAALAGRYVTAGFRGGRIDLANEALGDCEEIANAMLKKLEAER
jgi:hypothetical protein